jgi:hypothetical protein
LAPGLGPGLLIAAIDSYQEFEPALPLNYKLEKRTRHPASSNAIPGREQVPAKQFLVRSLARDCARAGKSQTRLGPGNTAYSLELNLASGYAVRINSPTLRV